MTAPNPAMTAARSGSRASRISSHSICHRVAPRARICRRSLGLRDPMAASVIPVTIGAAITVWAITMAVGVKSR